MLRAASTSIAGVDVESRSRTGLVRVQRDVVLRRDKLLPPMKHRFTCRRISCTNLSCNWNSHLIYS